MPTPLRRRWFQFSLATMFVVVALLALWLGWATKVIHERRDVLEWIKNNGGSYWTATDDSTAPGSRPESEPPVWRRWLGDEVVVGVAIPGDIDEADCARIQRLILEIPRDYPLKRRLFWSVGSQVDDESYNDNFLEP